MEVSLHTKTCPQCSESSKNLEILKRQKEFAKIYPSENNNDEIAMDLLKLFHSSKKKTLLRHSFLLIFQIGWRADHFFYQIQEREKLEFLRESLSTHGIPERVRTDPGVNGKVKLENFEYTIS